MVSWKKKGGHDDYFHSSTLHGADNSVATEVKRKNPDRVPAGEQRKKIV